MQKKVLEGSSFQNIWIIKKIIKIKQLQNISMKILEIIVSPESFLLTSLKNISSPQINYNIRHYSFILEVLKKNIHRKGGINWL